MKLYLCVYLPELERILKNRDLSSAKLLKELALWAKRFSPIAAADPGAAADPLHHGLILDITGTERLYKGEINLARKILNGLSRFNLKGKTGTAQTIGAAWALSRYGASDINILNGPIEKALDPLPLEALRLTDESLNGLHEVGIFKIKELLAIPRKELAKRFKSDLLKRIDQALGALEEPLKTASPQLILKIKKTFDPPLDRKRELRLALQRVFRDLFANLNHKGLHASAFKITFTVRKLNSRLSAINKELNLLSRISSGKDLGEFSLILSDLSDRLPPEGQVEKIEAAVLDPQRILYRQDNFLPGKESLNLKKAFKILLNTLTARLGKERIKTIRFYPSYLPENSYAFKPFADTKPKIVPLPAAALPRPSFILSRPESISALCLLPDHPPALILFRNNRYRVLRAAGPERISCEWWHEAPGAELKDRDYFTVQDEAGRLLWLYRESDTLRWFLHGVWS